MREIRIRLWDIERCRWLGGHDKFMSLDGQIYTSGGLNVTDRYIKCQLTGLKDKNGKEICEGDIVRGAVWYGWKNETGLGIVRFGEYYQDGSAGEYAGSNCCGWHIEILESGFKNLSSGEQSLYDGEDLKKSKRKEIEIIGNIHENPELLEAT